MYTTFLPRYARTYDSVVQTLKLGFVDLYIRWGGRSVDPNEVLVPLVTDSFSIIPMTLNMIWDRNGEGEGEPHLGLVRTVPGPGEIIRNFFTIHSSHGTEP